MSAEWRHAKTASEQWPNECVACRLTWPCDAEKMRDERDAAIRRASELSEAVQAYLDADASPAYSWVDEGQRERRGEANREKERMARVAAARAALRAALRSQESQKPPERTEP